MVTILALPNMDHEHSQPLGSSRKNASLGTVQPDAAGQQVTSINQMIGRRVKSYQLCPANSALKSVQQQTIFNAQQKLPFVVLVLSISNMWNDGTTWDL